MSTVFFWVSKLAAPFIAPLGLVLLIGALVLWVSRPWKKEKNSRASCHAAPHPRHRPDRNQARRAGTGLLRRGRNESGRHKAGLLESAERLNQAAESAVRPDALPDHAAGLQNPAPGGFPSTTVGPAGQTSPAGDGASPRDPVFSSAVPVPLRPSPGRRFRLFWVPGFACWLLLAALSSPGLSQTLITWWELPLPVEDPASLKGSVGVIAVLGGTIMPDVVQSTSAIQVNRTMERLLETARLWKAGVAPLVIVSGGSGDLYDQESREAPLMAAMLGDLGVPASALIQEPDSRNTRENLVNIRGMLEERGLKSVIIVSSALHLRRVEGLALKILGPPGRDFAWRLWSCDSDQVHLGFPEAVLPSASALEDSSRVLREVTGTLAYRIMGYL